MKKPAVTTVILLQLCSALALPQGGSSTDGPVDDLEWTTATCTDGSLTRANAEPLHRWQDAKAPSAWRYLRNVFFKRDGTRPQDYAFTSMGIADFFHSGDGMKCGGTGIDDSSCSATGRECEDLGGSPRPENPEDGVYPASFIVLNSIANFNNAIRNLWMPLHLRSWDTHMETMQVMVDTFTNGVDAVRARNKALDSLQLGLFVGLNPFFNALAAVPGLGAIANTVKDTAFAAVTYAVSRAKDDFAATMRTESDGYLMVSYIVNSSVTSLQDFNKFAMAYIPQDDWRSDPEGSAKRWEEGMDLLGRFIDNGAMLPNAFPFDSGFVDKYMHHVLNAMVLPRLWRMDAQDTKPVVLETGQPCDAPHTDYGRPFETDRPWFDPGKQEEYAVCYQGQRYYLVGADGEAFEERLLPIGRPTDFLPVTVPKSFKGLKGVDKLTEWGFSREGIVESAVEGKRIFGPRVAEAERMIDPGNWDEVWRRMDDKDLSKANRLPGIVGIPVCSVEEAQEGWMREPSNPNSPCLP